MPDTSFLFVFFYRQNEGNRGVKRAKSDVWTCRKNFLMFKNILKFKNFIKLIIFDCVINLLLCIFIQCVTKIWKPRDILQTDHPILIKFSRYTRVRNYARSYGDLRIVVKFTNMERSNFNRFSISA